MLSPKINPTRQQDPLLTVIANSFKLYKQSWRYVQINLTTFLWLYVLPILFAFGLFISVLPVLGIENLATDTIESIDTSAFTLGTGIQLAVGFIGFLIIAIFVAIALIVTQLRSIEKIKTSFSEAINLSLPFFWRFVWLGTLSAIVVLLGLIALIIPGVVLAFLLILSTYVLIDQNTTVVYAMKQSIKLSLANWKLLIGLLSIQFLIGMLGSIPVIGSILTMMVTVVYLCLPAIIYRRAVAAMTQKVTV